MKGNKKKPSMKDVSPRKQMAMGKKLPGMKKSGSKKAC